MEQIDLVEQIQADIAAVNAKLEQFWQHIRLIDESNNKPVVDSLLLLYDNGKES